MRLQGIPAPAEPTEDSGPDERRINRRGANTAYNPPLGFPGRPPTLTWVVTSR
jgi:hypothetical protein